MVIPVAHDFSCPWCWIALFQVKQLKEEFGVEIEWLPYELYPEGLEYKSSTPVEEPPNKPPVPTRLQLAYAAQGMERPTKKRPWPMRTHRIHEAVEFAKTENPRPDDFVEVIYRAYYEDAADIDDIEVITELAKPFVKDIDGMLLAIQQKRFAAKIIGFDQPSYDSGVYNVPTFYIGGERYAEQPYIVLQNAMKALGVHD